MTIDEIKAIKTKTFLRHAHYGVCSVCGIYWSIDGSAFGVGLRPETPEGEVLLKESGDMDEFWLDSGDRLEPLTESEAIA